MFEFVNLKPVELLTPNVYNAPALDNTKLLPPALEDIVNGIVDEPLTTNEPVTVKLPVGIVTAP